MIASCHLTTYNNSWVIAFYRPRNSCISRDFTSIEFPDTLSYFGGNGDDNVRVAKFNRDMVSLDGEVMKMSAPNFFEAAWVYKIGDTYYFSYCTTPRAEMRIDYMTSNNPTEGFTYAGVPDAGDSATLRVREGWLRVEDTIELGLNGGAAVLQLQLTGQLHEHRIAIGANSSIALNGGLLNADIVEGSIINSTGTIAPGENVFDIPNATIDFGGVDCMHVMGDLRLNGGAIQFVIAGDQPGEYDFVEVDGKLTGGGTLEVILDGYAPQAGDIFNLFDFSTCRRSILGCRGIPQRSSPPVSC